MKRALFIGTMFALLTNGVAHAAGLVAVRPATGYTCMMLNQNASETEDFRHPVSFKVQPSDTSPDVAPVGMQVAVKTGSKVINGYIEAVDFAFRPRWVAAKYLAPYHAKADPSAHCVPSVMSNGHLGFNFTH